MPTPPRLIPQAAAVPVRDGLICLVTSRSGRRWTIPKGLIDPGRTAMQTAEQETWEEAGLTGELEPGPVGTYSYEKFGGLCEVEVFLLRVTQAAERWPEQSFRRREWLTPDEACRRLENADLRAIVAAVRFG